METIKRISGFTRLHALLTSATTKKYLQNVSWLVAEKLFTLTVALLVNIYVARYLQPESFGLLNFAIGFVGIFSAFTTLGLEQILVRELSTKPHLSNKLLGTGFILKTLGSVLLIVVMVIVLPLMNNPAMTNTLIYVIASAEIFKSFDVINSYFQSRVESKYVVKTQMAVNLSGNVIKVVLVFVHADLIWFAWVIVMNGVMNALGFVVNYYLRKGVLWRWQFDTTLSRKLLLESWPVAIHGIALLTQARIDQVMLGKLAGNAAVGQYSVALRFIEIFSFIPIVLLNTFLPAVSRAKEQGIAVYEDRLVNLYRLMFAMFIVVALPIFFFGKATVVFLYGVEYAPAGILLSLFAIRLFFTNMGLAKSVYTINESLFKISLLATTIGAGTNILINYLLIPDYGVYGALIATVVSFTVSDFLVDLMFSITRKNQRLIFTGICSFWKLNPTGMKS